MSPYYRGDYYRGDYYRGDLFGAIKGGLSGFFKSGITGAVSGAIAGAKGKTNLPAVVPMISPISTFASQPGTQVGMSANPSTPGAVPTPGWWQGTVSRFLPGGSTGYSAAPPGYHINKAYLHYLRAQAFGRKATDPFSRPAAVNAVVRNRKVNVTNPRALRRALARAHGFARLARQVLTFTTGKRPKGTPRFKTRRKKK